MAFYARKLRHCVNHKVGVCVALIEITKKRGMFPVKFVLYRSIGRGGIFESIDFAGNKRKTAIKAFPFGPITFDDRARELMRKGVSRPRCINLWEKTTDWLNNVAVGGAYTDGAWVKVGKPNTWRQRHARGKKRTRLKFGSLEHKLLVIRKEIFCLKGQTSEKREELDLLHLKYNNEKGEAAWGLLSKKVAAADALKALEAAIDDMKATESRIVAEMTYVRDKKFPPTVAP